MRQQLRNYLHKNSNSKAGRFPGEEGAPKQTQACPRADHFRREADPRSARRRAGAQQKEAYAGTHL